MDRARSGRVLGFSLLILLALGGTLTLAGQGRTVRSADADPRQEQLDPRELTRISLDSTPAVARRVERLRELRFRRLPRPEVVSSGHLNRLGLRELERQSGGLRRAEPDRAAVEAPGSLVADNAIGRITGLLSADEDLADAYSSTGDLAAAAYDTRTKRLYVVEDAVVANRALVEFVLAHELDHVLEDQHFGLPEAIRLDDDAALAQMALVEGSATAVMTDYAIAHLDALDLLSATQAIDPGTAGVPEAYVDQLTWAYIGGLRFISTLRELADGWKLVDYALGSRPPVTTEQVLHPDKYIDDELPAQVRIEPRELRSRGWRPADRGVFGELPTSLLLRVGADPTLARRAAAGWDGDRYELWRRDSAPRDCEGSCRSDLVLVARWRWDSGPDRRQFDRAATAYVEDGLAGNPLARGVWRIEDGFVALRSGARAATLVFAPGPTAARAIAAAQSASGAETIPR